MNKIQKIAHKITASAYNTELKYQYDNIGEFLSIWFVSDCNYLRINDLIQFMKNMKEELDSISKQASKYKIKTFGNHVYFDKGKFELHITLQKTRETIDDKKFIEYLQLIGATHQN